MSGRKRSLLLKEKHISKRVRLAVKIRNNSRPLILLESHLPGLKSQLYVNAEVVFINRISPIKK